MKILIINGSHRKGNTDIIINRLIALLPEQYEIRHLILREIEMKLPDGCELCAESEICPNTNDEFSQKIEPTIRNYDVYIIATPTWDDGLTPLTKIFWDRIVSWCHKSRKYLKNKKLSIITHGMADQKSWDNVVNWTRGICSWEKCVFAGFLTLKTGSRIGNLNIDEDALNNFIQMITNK